MKEREKEEARCEMKMSTPQGEKKER